jgi:hypothetical protein
MNIRYKITVPTRFPLELFEKNQLLYSVGVHFLMLKFPLGFMSPSYRELCMYNRVDYWKFLTDSKTAWLVYHVYNLLIKKLSKQRACEYIQNTRVHTDILYTDVHTFIRTEERKGVEQWLCARNKCNVCMHGNTLSQGIYNSSHQPRGAMKAHLCGIEWYYARYYD